MTLFISELPGKFDSASTDEVHQATEHNVQMCQKHHTMQLDYHTIVKRDISSFPPSASTR